MARADREGKARRETQRGEKKKNHNAMGEQQAENQKGRSEEYGYSSGEETQDTLSRFYGGSGFLNFISRTEKFGPS